MTQLIRKPFRSNISKSIICRVELFLRFKQDSRLVELLSDKDKEKILKYITK